MLSDSDSDLGNLMARNKQNNHRSNSQEQNYTSSQPVLYSGQVQQISPIFRINANSAVNKDTHHLLPENPVQLSSSEVVDQPKVKMRQTLQLNYQYFSFTSTEMDREEAKEKESCEKSASEESKLGTTKNLWKYNQTRGQEPKFLDGSSMRQTSQFAGSLFSP